MTRDGALRLARECGATVYQNRHLPGEPAVAFGNESWARFCDALEQPDPFAHLSDADLMAMQPSAQPRRHISYVCPQCDASMVPEEQTQQEPVAHLWECLGRWSAYLASNGWQADLAPPQWLCDAINAATTPPRREWVGLDRKEMFVIIDQQKADKRTGLPMFWRDQVGDIARAIEARLKERNA